MPPPPIVDVPARAHKIQSMFRSITTSLMRGPFEDLCDRPLREIREMLAHMQAQIAVQSTRTDKLLEQVGNIRGEIGELRGEIGELRGEMRGEIGSLKTEVAAVKSDVTLLRTDTAQRIIRLEDRSW